jgi:hypothetical protein
VREEEEEDEEEDEEDSKLIARAQKKYKVSQRRDEKTCWVFSFFLVKIGKNWYLVKNKCELSP